MPAEAASQSKSNGASKPSPGKHRTFTPEYKAAAVKRVMKGEGVPQVAADLNMSGSVLRNWLIKAGVPSAAEERAKVKKKPDKRNPFTVPKGMKPSAQEAQAIRDTIIYLKHATTEMYARLQAGTLKEFEEYHLHVLAAYKRLQSIA